MAILNDSTVEVKRSFPAPAEAVFGAIAAGVLFRTCGAKPETIKMDFREGGAFSMVFAPNIPFEGTFKKIEKNKRIVLGWGKPCAGGNEHGQAEITLTEKQGRTELHLLHTGIPSLEHTKDIDHGWRDGINDFTPHITRTVKVEREFNAPVEQVFELVAGTHFFVNVGAFLDKGRGEFKIGGKFSYKVAGCSEKHGEGTLEGEYTDIIPNRRIAFTWIAKFPQSETGETIVLVDFAKKGEDKCLMTLTHAGFATEAAAKEHEEGWTEILASLAKERR